MVVFYFLIATLGVLVVLRSILLLIFSEIGRKQDLIKHIYKSGTDFQIAVVIPYIDARKLGAFQELIQALTKQDYPMSRVGIHVVATEDKVYGLPDQADLPANVKVWTYPAKNASRGHCLSWLIERLLAAGGPSKLFVFLDADDIVRPDFLRNVTTRAFDCFVMQGYVALKRPPRGIVAQVQALSVRLINRIENAGRFHMGLSSKLLNSGWVVRQEILEMLPFRQGQDIDCQEYTSLLNLNGYRVNWAPNVVVYRDDKVDFLSLLKDAAHSFINRLRLTVQYVPQLLLKGVTRLDFNLFEQAWSIVKPPHFVVGAIGVVGAVILLKQPLFPSSFYLWSVFVLGFWTTQLLSLAVARCSFKDVLFFIFATPLVYVAGLVMFPISLLNAVAEAFMGAGNRSQRVRVGKRFDESLPPRNNSVLAKTKNRGKAARNSQRLLPSLQDDTMLYDEDDTFLSDISQQPLSGLNERMDLDQPLSQFASIYEDKLTEPEPLPVRPVSENFAPQPQPQPQQQLPQPVAFNAMQPYEEKTMIPITNGKNTISCLLRSIRETDASGEPTFYLIFEYKTLTFTTARYRLLDQAYYELLTKLREKGFNITSCGSCAYFFRPPAGSVPEAYKEFGFCLFGKLGQELNYHTDAITVISQACQEYTDMQYREAAVQQWQASLQQIPAYQPL